MVDQAFGRLRPVPECPRFRPSSRVTLDDARGAAVSNSSPRRLALGLGYPGSTSVPVRLLSRSKGPRG